jgi:hypothetical protein
MLRPSHAVLLALCIAFAPRVHAQEPGPGLVVRTFTLRHMQPDDAAKLVAPYVMSAKGGVFEAGGAVRAITVRETPQVLARIDSLLRAHDRTPRVIVLRFQLLSADDTPTRDPAVAAIDSTLRRLFRFTGYRLLSEGSAIASEHEHFSLTLAAADERFALAGNVHGVRAVDGRGSIHVGVSLSRPATAVQERMAGGGEVLLSTRVTVPIGQTAVLGSAAPGGKIQALILVIRPELGATPDS